MSFDMLLACLDPDREVAGLKYEKMRQRIMKFFECRGARSPEDLFDETMRRVETKISEGESIRAEDPFFYVLGFARNVLREQWAVPVGNVVEFDPNLHSERVTIDPVAEEEEEVERRKHEKRLSCLEMCIEEFPPETRRLVTEYYTHEKGEKIKHRKLLAKQLGVTMNTLGVRMLRIRQKLEVCIEKCCSRPLEDL